MIDILAQAASSADSIGTAVGAAILVLGGREGIAWGQRKRANGSAYNKELCNERHRALDARQSEFRQDIKDIHGKLDKLLQHQLGGDTQ